MWEDCIHLVEFPYNNGHNASLKMSSFEELYGRKCNTLLSWYNTTNKEFIGPDLLEEMEEKMTRIKHNLKDAQDRKKSYVDKNKVFRYFKVVEHVFLKVNSKRSSLRLGSFPKCESRKEAKGEEILMG
jgi:hypothetical protein